MTPKNLQDLYIHQLRDLYSAEDQIAANLPAMIKQASHQALKDAFQTHLEETKRQKERLEQLFKGLGESPNGVTCKATKGLVQEAKDFMSDTHNLLGSDAPDEVIDAGLIAMAQRIEHYEIAGYGTVVAYAETLGRSDDVRMLQTTLDEESNTDEKLTKLAESLVNPAAVGV